MERLVIALGGNALLPPGEARSFDAMRIRVAQSARTIADVAEDARLVVTHGNGPQVGNLLLQAEAARAQVAPPPLDVLVAQTQAQLGYLLQQAVQNELTRRGHPDRVVTLVTQVVVDADDPAFDDPTKPVGPAITSETEAMLKRAKGWRLTTDPRGGWRRTVPSPRPLEIVEAEAIRHLVELGFLVIATGGGGVPVVRDSGRLRGVEAVIDKDLASAVLALALRADRLVLATDVEGVALHYGKPEQRFVDRMTVEHARRYLKEGHFPPGSMGPKVEAAIDFAAATGKEAIITDTGKLVAALAGDAGTHVVP